MSIDLAIVSPVTHLSGHQSCRHHNSADFLFLIDVRRRRRSNQDIRPRSFEHEHCRRRSDRIRQDVRRTVSHFRLSTLGMFCQRSLLLPSPPSPIARRGNSTDLTIQTTPAAPIYCLLCSDMATAAMDGTIDTSKDIPLHPAASTRLGPRPRGGDQIQEGLASDALMANATDARTDGEWFLTRVNEDQPGIFYRVHVASLGVGQSLDVVNEEAPSTARLKMAQSGDDSGQAWRSIGGPIRRATDTA